MKLISKARKESIGLEMRDPVQAHGDVDSGVNPFTGINEDGKRLLSDRVGVRAKGVAHLMEMTTYLAGVMPVPLRTARSDVKKVPILRECGDRERKVLLPTRVETNIILKNEKAVPVEHLAHSPHGGVPQVQTDSARPDPVLGPRVVNLVSELRREPGTRSIKPTEKLHLQAH